MNKQIRQAICRIDVTQDAGSVSRGTGTLVGPGLVLTALHVVADRRANPPARYPGKITLTFPDHQTEAEIHETFMDPGADWVLLKCAQPPTIEPVALGRLKQSGIDWETYGFPDANPRDGMVQTGRVEAWDGLLEGSTALQLFSEEAAAGNGAPVKGLSGAPVFVGTWLVGHMRFALMQDGRTVAGTLYACPVESVGAKSPGLLKVLDVPERRSTITSIVSEFKNTERKTRWITMAGVLVLAGIVAVAATLLGGSPKPAPPAIQELGVLPFQNLTGREGHAASMGGGMRAIILGELRRISSLRVVDLANIDLGTIGAGKNAGPDLRKAGLTSAAIVDGHILPSDGDDAKIEVMLRQRSLDGAGWNTIWENTYDVHGQNAFEVQNQVAREVASELEVRVSRSDSVLLASAHTGDSSAAEFFLLGKNLLDQAFFDPEAAKRAAIMLSRAVDRDPGFAIAYARLSDAHSLIYYLGVDESAARDQMAHAAADTALALQPDLPEGHLALGAYWFRVKDQPYLALQELGIAERSLHQDSKLLMLRGLILRRMPYRWDYATCALRQASELEPGNWAPAYYAGQTYLFSRDYEHAEQFLTRAIQDSAQSVGLDQRARAYLSNAAMLIARSGDVAGARAIVAQAEKHFTPTALLAALSLDEFRPLLRLVASPHLDSLLMDADQSNAENDTDYFLARAILAEAGGNQPAVALNYITATVRSQALIGRDKLDVEPHIDLAIALAAQGRTPESAREVATALRLLNGAGHFAGSVTVGRAATRGSVARLQVAAGNIPGALATVRWLFENPGYLSPEWIEADPGYARLRADPAYPALKRAFYRQQVTPLLYRSPPAACPSS
jgi:TolB-like protein/tetratricopeptide (TPR) repeat protein